MREVPRRHGAGTDRGPAPGRSPGLPAPLGSCAALERLDVSQILRGAAKALHRNQTLSGYHGYHPALPFHAAATLPDAGSRPPAHLDDIQDKHLRVSRNDLGRPVAMAPARAV